MIDYWESKFKNEGAMWEFEPSDSAKIALKLFDSDGINNILIPGFGYGRNAKLFLDNGFNVTGIEISKSAIEIAKANKLKCKIHHGSVTLMPFDSKIFNGVYCYALMHLLNKYERRDFLKSCFKQLHHGGLMVFVVSNKRMSMYGTGKLISKDRFKISNGLNVYFYDSDSIKKEFSEFGFIESKDIDEPMKFMEGQEPLKLKLVICKKMKTITDKRNKLLRLSGVTDR